jgi:hypothetical protein
MYNSDLYDVIIFHEGNIPEDHQKFIQSFTPNMPIIFRDVSKEFSPTLVKTESKWARNDPEVEKFSIGYRHMIRFWMGPFLDHLKEYEYIIRVDEDCIVGQFPTTILQEMRENKIRFSTGKIYWEFKDHPGVIIGVQGFADEFGKENGVEPPLLTTEAPYNSVSITDNLYFRNSELYTKWFKKIDEDGGIFVGRWGDNVLLGIFFANFLTKKDYVEDRRIVYYHGSHQLRVN